MEENILLTFLSDVKVFDGKVSETIYENVDGAPVHTTNESAVRYLLQHGVKFSKIFILASKKIRGEIGNGFSETHLDYFKNRMQKFLDAENCITAETIYPYNEDNKGEENLKSVAEIAERIQNYARGKKIFLHVDLTGGMRHINMMMLDIVRLLEYSGVEVGRLIYSNFTTKRVEEVKNIYDLFQLISGVEEFINFGSVNALKKYYAQIEQSEKLKNLLAAMKNFADAIKLCRYGKFTDAIKQLHDAINDFETTPENVQDILMARLIGKIREKYENLIATRGEDDLKILSWCIENGYLQQALTLYTERVPKYLYKNFVVLRENDVRTVEKILAQDNRNIGFYVLNNYLEDDKDFTKARADFENCVDALNKKYFSVLKKFMQSKNLNFADLQKKCFDNKNLPRGVKFPDAEIFKTFDEINNNPKILLNLDAAELSPLKKIIAAVNLENFKYGKQRLQEIFRFLNSAELSKYFPAYEYDTRIFRLEYMLNKKIFRLKMDSEIFFCVMEKYFQFKDERNHSNHARKDGTGKFSTAKKLQTELQRGLEEIEAVKKIELAEIKEPAEVKQLEKIFVNHTNHDSAKWSAEQKSAAEKFGRIVNLPFPDVPPNLTNKEIKQMVSKNLQEILKLKPAAVLCQGEFNYTFIMVEELKNLKIPVFAATSERVVEEITENDGSNKRISIFKFVNFRPY